MLERKKANKSVEGTLAKPRVPHLHRWPQQMRLLIINCLLLFGATSALAVDVLDPWAPSAKIGGEELDRVLMEAEAHSYPSREAELPPVPTPRIKTRAEMEHNARKTLDSIRRGERPAPQTVSKEEIEAFAAVVRNSPHFKKPLPRWVGYFGDMTKAFVAIAFLIFVPQLPRLLCVASKWFDQTKT